MATYIKSCDSCAPFFPCEPPPSELTIVFESYDLWIGLEATFLGVDVGNFCYTPYELEWSPELYVDWGRPSPTPTDTGPFYTGVSFLLEEARQAGLWTSSININFRAVKSQPGRPWEGLINCWLWYGEESVFFGPVGLPDVEGIWGEGCNQLPLFLDITVYSTKQANGKYLSY